MQRDSDISIWKHFTHKKKSKIAAVKNIYDDIDGATIQLHLQILILQTKAFNWDAIY